ncbi:preprotein translocase subunit SecE [Lachnobacterium bovis]|uniref:Preprotein translocase subunit SecE n=1 Tax=Lachnobacterium bovis DSM 14045 TaxID=1122142 RepID=A0A1H3GJU2_9FIRM|nr:preprotein translocase subunit SecE [Lachnobacterium bovis]SDY02529.1 preprotein translocase subunit SecE [Lachnobacterium bovis DSM 14045]
MGETEKLEKAPKTSWFTGLKTEFKKIIWPDQKTLTRQTTAVIVISIVAGAIIALMDRAIQYGVDYIVGFTL